MAETAVEKNLAETRTAVRKAVDLYLNNVDSVDAELLAESVYECLSDEFHRLYATEAAAKLLVDRWEQMATNEGKALQFLEGPNAEWVADTASERLRTYCRAAADVRNVLATGRIPHDLMTDAELEQHGKAQS